MPVDSPWEHIVAVAQVYELLTHDVHVLDLSVFWGTVLRDETHCRNGNTVVVFRCVTDSFALTSLSLVYLFHFLSAGSVSLHALCRRTQSHHPMQDIPHKGRGTFPCLLSQVAGSSA